jgi:hypothetical protein
LNRLVINLFRKLLITSYRNQYLRLSTFPVVELFAWQLPLFAARLFEVQSYPKEKAFILKRIDSLLNLDVEKTAQASKGWRFKSWK